jgi:hypothetical protein
MQTKWLKLASGIHNLVSERSKPLHRFKPGDTMSDTTALRLTPANTLFGRLMGSIDRLLMAHARIAIRNGDLPYFGL